MPIPRRMQEYKSARDSLSVEKLSSMRPTIKRKNLSNTLARTVKVLKTLNQSNFSASLMTANARKEARKVVSTRNSEGAACK